MPCWCLTRAFGSRITSCTRLFSRCGLSPTDTYHCVPILAPPTGSKVSSYSTVSTLTVQASWDDVVLEDKFKKSIQNDYRSFFKSEETYKRLQVPWKRGLIFMGVCIGLLPFTPRPRHNTELNA